MKLLQDAGYGAQGLHQRPVVCHEVAWARPRRPDWQAPCACRVDVPALASPGEPAQETDEMLLAHSSGLGFIACCMCPRPQICSRHRIRLANMFQDGIVQFAAATAVATYAVMHHAKFRSVRRGAPGRQQARGLRQGTLPQQQPWPLRWPPRTSPQESQAGSPLQQLSPLTCPPVGRSWIFHRFWLTRVGPAGPAARQADRSWTSLRQVHASSQGRAIDFILREAHECKQCLFWLRPALNAQLVIHVRVVFVWSRKT